MQPHDFWQRIEDADDAAPPAGGHRDFFPAILPKGQVLRLPIRVLPGQPNRAVASLILNQASFAVLDALAAHLADKLAPHRPDVIVAVPTLGLPLAEAAARRLGHRRMVALGTSRKFWYQDEFSAPMSSITSPDHAKRLYVDPRMLPLLAGRRVALVDDVISTGTSIQAALSVLKSAAVTPAVVGVAMLQSGRWRSMRLDAPLESVFETPLLARTPEDGWLPA